MAKKSRRDRRAGRQRQDPQKSSQASLEALALRDPILGGNRLRGALAGANEADARALLELIARIVGQLRERDRHSAALLIAEAGERRTLEICLEEALAAFALGQDERVSEIAERDPRLAKALTPLLDATRGKAPEIERKGSALDIALSTVAHAVAFEAATARASLGKLRGEARERWLGDELRLALELAEGRWRPKILALASGEAARASQLAREAILSEMIMRGGDAAFDALLNARVPTVEEVGTLDLRFVLSDPSWEARKLSEREIVLELIERGLGESFPRESRAAALILQGYRFIEERPTDAEEALDEAIEEGGDLIEALRGKLLLHWEHEGCETLARSCDQLAQALEESSAMRIFTQVLSEKATSVWLERAELSKARGSLARARRASSGAVDDDLDVLSALILMSSDRSKQARRAIDEILERNPRHIDAWSVRASWATGSEERLRVLEEAFEVTGEARFAERARVDNVALGNLRAFEGLIPGRPSPGQLAVELESFLRAQHDLRTGLSLPPEVKACLEALSPEEEDAFDAAALVLLAEMEAEALAESWLGEIFLEERAIERDFVPFVALALHLGFDELLLRSFRSLAPRPGSPFLTGAFLHGATQAGRADLARRMVGAAAPLLSMARLQLLERTLAHAEEIGELPVRIGSLLGPLDDLLRPEFNLVERLDAASPPPLLCR